MANQLKLDLLNKYMAIVDFLQECNQRLSPADLPNFAMIMANAELEMRRVELLLDLLRANQPISFPSDEQIERLQATVGRLQQVVNHNAAINDLMEAATAAISSWPVSDAG